MQKLDLMILKISGKYSWEIFEKNIPSWKCDQYRRMKSIKKATASAFGYYMAKIGAYNLGYDGKVICRENGKPDFVEENLYFNISHSKDMVVCGMGAEPIGVDIEKISPNFYNITEGFLSWEERKIYENIQKQKRSEFLCTIWTLKEAYGKWLGVGLDYPIKKVNFICDSVEWKCVAENSVERQCPCKISTYKLIDNFMVSVCSESCTNIDLQYLTEEMLLQKGKDFGLC